MQLMAYRQIQSIILKIYNYFSIYTVRTEANEDFSSLLSDKKWVKYFEQRSYDTSSELLKICTFHFAIPAQNANVERIFSLMKAQWTDDRYRLLPDSVKHLLMTQYNFKHFDCTQFYDYCIKDKSLLSKIRSSNKYMIYDNIMYFSINY